MKRILSLILALSMLLALCACTGIGDTETEMNETTLPIDTNANESSDSVSISETESATHMTESTETVADTDRISETEERKETETLKDMETTYVTESESEAATTSEAFEENSSEAVTETETETEVSLPIGSVIDTTIKGDRPVLFVTDEMLASARAKALAGEEPWYSEWSAIETKANNALMYGPSPDTGASATAYRLAACNDFVNARYLALAYIYSEDERYLESALYFLMTYAEQMLGTDKYLDYSAPTTDGEADIGLNIAAPLTAACDVYSLLYPYIEDSDKAIIEKWIKTEAKLCIKGHEFWIENDFYLQQYGNNHLTSHLMGIIAAAYVLEEDFFLEYALSYEGNTADLLEMIDHSILMEGDEVYRVDTDSDFVNGEIYDRYRVVQNNGFGYSMYHLKFLTYSALMLYHNGVNLFDYYGTNGENLLLSFHAYADYLSKNDITLGVGHYSNDKGLNRENAISTYSIAYYVYKDETVRKVIEDMRADGVSCNEIEVLGITGTYLFGLFD